MSQSRGHEASCKLARLIEVLRALPAERINGARVLVGEHERLFTGGSHGKEEGGKEGESEEDATHGEARREGEARAADPSSEEGNHGKASTS